MSKKTVLLTGASRGIGLGILGCLLAEFDVNVVTVSRTISPELESLSQKHAGNLTVVLGDLTTDTIHTEAVSTLVSKYGRLDSIILNAGALALGPSASPSPLSIDAWKAHFDINFFALLRTIHAAAPELRKSGQGSLIFVSSGAATKGVKGWGPYSAGKAAMNSLARTLASEEPDFTTIAIRPGTVDTAMLETIRSPHGGGAAMDPQTYHSFVTMKLLSANEPGYVIAGLAARGVPKALSGEFISWNGEEMGEFQRGIGGGQ